MRAFRRSALLVSSCLMLAAGPATGQATSLELRTGESIVFVGNTLAERMQSFPHLEALVTARHPDLRLRFRYLAWSGDELNLRPRPLNFGDLHTHLTEQRADVILAAFGLNESFRGEAYLPEFRAALYAFVDSLARHRYNGSGPPRIVLLSPIPHERVERVPVDPAPRNETLARYVDVMREVAADRGVHFVDLFAPLRPHMDDPALGDLTINGIHLDDRGNRIAARVIASRLGWLPADADPLAAAEMPPEPLVEAIRQKNELFFLRWRAVNGEYIYGRRREPFGVVNFPEEMRRMEEMIAEREAEIWRLAAGGTE